MRRRGQFAGLPAGNSAAAKLARQEAYAVAELDARYARLKAQTVKNTGPWKNPKAKQKRSRVKVDAGAPHAIFSGAPPPMNDSELCVYLTRTPNSDANAPGSLIADSGANRQINIETGLGWSNAVLNGVVSKMDSRYPDPFTLVKTFTTCVSTTLMTSSIATSTSSSSTSYDYAAMGIFNGSPAYTYTTLIGQQYSLVTTPGRMRWDLNSATHWTNGAVNSSDFYSRPNGVVLTVRFHLVGPTHKVRVFAVPVPPMNIATYATAYPNGWQSYPMNGLTSQEVTWGGREWEINPDDTGIRLAAMPVDSRSLDFESGSNERDPITSASHTAWAGWRWWAFGMSSVDACVVTCNYLEEHYPVMFNVTPLYYFPTTDKQANSTYRDHASNTITSAASKGLTGYKLFDGIINFVEKGLGWWNKISTHLGNFAGVFNPLLAGPNNGVTTNFLGRPLMLRADESKEGADEDYVRVPRREAERLTSATSSSSSKAK